MRTKYRCLTPSMIFALVAMLQVAAAQLEQSAAPKLDKAQPAADVDASQPSPLGPSQAGVAVGMRGKLEQVVLPGPLLRVKPLRDRHEPFVLRIVRSFKHGTDNRYDFEFSALEPGIYNLSDYLERSDEAGESALPAVLVRAESMLPPGQTLPSQLPPASLPRIGGYGWAWIIGTLVWLVGLWLLLTWGKKTTISTNQTVEAPKSLADRLRPLIQAAREGTLAPQQRAELEQSLIAFWCEKLKLGYVAPGEVMPRLREHPQAGELLKQLEMWLHCPDAQQAVDVEKLLEPYTVMPDSFAVDSLASDSSLPSRFGSDDAAESHETTASHRPGAVAT